MAMDRRTRALSSLVLGVLVATLVVYLALDAIACPDGYGDPSARRAEGPGKTRLQLTCYADGAKADGSMGMVMLSWLSLFLATTIGSYTLVNKLRPVPNEVAPAAPTTAALSDKKERRKARKRARR